MKPYYAHGGITIYHGDCREILPSLGKFDLLLTDPPYGIGYESTFSAPVRIANDDGALDLRFIFGLARHEVVFGANCFPHALPSRGRWICWDKRVDPKADNMKGSPFELAWTNRMSGFDWMFRVMHGGVVNDDGKGARVHPTQKPLRLMQGILQRFVALDQGIRSVLDPFIGSGTTLRAAKDTGLQAVGIEIEERYCEIAAKRLAQEVLF